MDRILEEIKELKQKKNAQIIAHFYEPPEIQDLADFVGDSLAMARFGKESDAETLIICGVKFMAESAKILSPEKTILLPTADAGCTMADMVDAEALAAYKEDHPGLMVVSYVNTSAAVKALTDVCVTSSNALHIMENLEEKDILFLPDKNLGSYIASKVPDKKITLWQGYCNTHDQILPETVAAMKEEHPDADVLVHPECRSEVVAMADYAGSTAGIINYAAESDKDSFIIVTENGVMHKLQKDNPDKQFYLASKELICPDMKRISLEAVRDSLKLTQHEIDLNEDIRANAYKALDRMLELSR